MRKYRTHLARSDANRSISAEQATRMRTIIEYMSPYAGKFSYVRFILEPLMAPLPLRFFGGVAGLSVPKLDTLRP